MVAAVRSRPVLLCRLLVDDGVAAALVISRKQHHLVVSYRLYVTYGCGRWSCFMIFFSRLGCSTVYWVFCGYYVSYMDAAYFDCVEKVLYSVSVGLSLKDATFHVEGCSTSCATINVGIVGCSTNCAAAKV